MNWRDVQPDVGMLYRNRVRTRAEIDALRHLTHKGRMRQNAEHGFFRQAGIVTKHSEISQKASAARWKKKNGNT